MSDRDAIDARINDAVERHDNGQISTERLFQMVADDCNVDHGRIASAMKRRWEKSKAGHESRRSTRIIERPQHAPAPDAFDRGPPPYETTRA